MDERRLARQTEEARRRATSLRAELECGGGSPATLSRALDALDWALGTLDPAGESAGARGPEEDPLGSGAERYAELFEHAADALLVTDLRGVIEEANRAAGTLLERPPSRLVGKPLQALLDPQRRGPFPSSLATMQSAEQEPARRDLVLETRSGRIVETSASVARLRDRAGRVTRLRWALRDVTEVRRSERERELVMRLALAVGRATDLAEALREALATICGDLGWVFAEAWLVEPSRRRIERALHYGSGAAARAFEGATQGMPLAEGEGLVGRAWKSGRPEWLPEVDDETGRARAEAARAAGLRGGLAVPVHAEGAVIAVLAFYSRSTAGRDDRLVELSAAALAPLGALVQRQRAAEALRRERDFAARLFETAHAVVVLLDPEGRILRFNRYLETISGWRAEELSGEDWFEVFIPERRRETTRTLYAELVAGPSFGPRIDLLLTRSGGEREIEWYGSVLRDAEGRLEAVLGVGHDVTEQRVAERRMQAAEERMRRSERLASIGTLASGIAHELNNPVGSILLAASAALEVPETEEKRTRAVASALASIQEDARRCRGIVREVLQFARSGGEAREPADLNALVSSIRTRLAPAAAEVGASIETGLAPALPPVELSITQIGQVLENLVENALALGARRVTLLTRAGRETVELAVDDDGPGIEPAARDQLFDPFFTTRRARGGTGLGLSIVHRIVTDHGGRINVESEPGHGARFVVALPRRAPDAELREGAREGGPDGERPRRG